MVISAESLPVSDSVEVMTRRKNIAQKSRDIMQGSMIRMAWAQCESVLTEFSLYQGSVALLLHSCAFQT